MDITLISKGICLLCYKLLSTEKTFNCIGKIPRKSIHLNIGNRWYRASNYITPFWRICKLAKSLPGNNEVWRAVCTGIPTLSFYINFKVWSILSIVLTNESEFVPPAVKLRRIKCSSRKSVESFNNLFFPQSGWLYTVVNLFPAKGGSLYFCPQK